MKSACNTFASLLSLAMLAIVLGNSVGCSSGPVVEVEPCVEIPFVDGAEGACTNTVTHRAYWVPAKEWKQEKPTMIMLRASDWSKIRVAWLNACAGSDDCNVYIYTVDKTVRDLNAMLEKFDSQGLLK